MAEDKFDIANLESIKIQDVVETYQCMSEDIRTVVVCKRVTLLHTDGFSRTQSNSGFVGIDETLVFINPTPLESESTVESAFVCMSLPLPSRIFKDAFPQPFVSLSIDPTKSIIHSTPSMLFSWSPADTLPLRADADISPMSDAHIDVVSAAARISKYMKTPRGELTGISRTVSSNTPTSAIPVQPKVNPIVVSLPRKRPRDAREFREQILSNGAQAEFFVWSHIKARYGDAADLSWWLTSTKRQFFPTDLTPIDDAVGSDFFIPKDDYCLFSSKRGGAVHIEVKGTGRCGGTGEALTFEISRNELKTANQVNESPDGQEYVVAVVSGISGMGRPRLEAIVRDLKSLELTPTRFIATVPAGALVTGPSQPTGGDVGRAPLTQSKWYT